MERADRCCNGHIKIAGDTHEATPNCCNICFKTTDDNIALTKCYDCDLNYCASCEAIRQMNLKELLLSEEAMQGHGKITTSLAFLSIIFTGADQVIMDQLKAYRFELMEADEDGELPLHIALKNRIPSEVIMVIVNAFPDAVSIPDTYGFFPIHLAAMYLSSKEVISLLLEIFRGGMNEPDPDGYTLVHLMIKYHVDIDTIRFVVEKFPKSLNPFMKGIQAFARSLQGQHFIPW